MDEDEDVVLSGECADAHPRPVLSTCTLPVQSNTDGIAGFPSIAATHLHVKAYIYVVSDRVLMSCLSEGGQWTTLASDHPDVERFHALNNS